MDGLIKQQGAARAERFHALAMNMLCKPTKRLSVEERSERAVRIAFEAVDEARAKENA